MKYDQLQAQAKFFAPAIWLGEKLPRRHRGWLRLLVMVMILGTFILQLVLGWQLLWLGLILILTALWLVLLMLTVYHNSYYFYGLAKGEDKISLSYEVAQMVVEASGSQDVAGGLFSTTYGHEVLRRSGADPQAVIAYLRERSTPLAPANLIFPAETRLRIATIVSVVLAADEPLRQVLFHQGVGEEDVLGAARWIDQMIASYKTTERIWDRGFLSHIPGLGHEWEYGRAYTLEHFGSYLDETSYYRSSDPDLVYGQEDVRTLAAILARSRNNNAFLVGNDTATLYGLLGMLSMRIHRGEAPVELTDRRLFLFDGPALVTTAGDKVALERLLGQILTETVQAGNLILILDDLPAMMASARAVDVDLVTILEPYLGASDLPIIGLADHDGYYQILEPLRLLRQHTETVLVHEADPEAVLRFLSDAALALEAKYSVTISYPTLRTIALNAERFLSGQGTLADQSLNLLSEVIPYVVNQKREIVTPNDVLTLLEAQTGVALGTPTARERDTLLNLEERLHERVVGQDEAISAIAEALRRSRAGIRNQERPIGSFLFLGPTGVGKTETAKALAEILFGDEEKISRLDMAEFQGEDAVEKLIGVPGSSMPGALSRVLTESPYGVLLLDEFEKSSSAVRNIFLSVLDEGIFTTTAGNRINARNTIIIATSNAGDELLWKYSESGESIDTHRDDLIDHIVAAGIFTPELINRFDGTIIFQSHAPAARQQIARLLLDQVRNRLRERGVDVSWAPDVAEYVAEKGYDAKFGARPMNRFIQEEIEAVLAKKILAGELPIGSSVTITRADLGASSTSAAV
jgi:ATP-dependent Clp protease ATP-binding subunit ClpC